MTITLTGGNGPTNCSTGPQIGQVETYPLGVNQSPPMVQLVLDPKNWPTDHSGDYAGSLNGTTISAAGHYYGWSSKSLCGGNTIVGGVDYGVPASFTGTLSVDGALLTGHEVRTTMLAQTVLTYEYDWRSVLK